MFLMFNHHGKHVILSSELVDPDVCDHDSKGDVVCQAKSGKYIYWHTYREWAHLPTDERLKLIQQHHNFIDDPILMMTATCSKCKGWTINHSLKYSP